MINDSIDRVVYNVTVGNGPEEVAVNPGSNLVYVSNTLDDTVSVINGTTNKLDVGLNFNINSPSSGSISCENYKNANTVLPVVWNRIPNNDYLRYDYGTTLDCKADANTWSI